MNVLVQLVSWLGLFAVFAVSNPISKSNGKRVVCYFGSWAVYRYGNAKITANDIDCSICTHFIYTFVGLDEQSGNIIFLDPYNDIGDEWKVGLLPTLQKKCRASGTKFMVAIGGWNEGSTKYSNVVANPVKRQTLKNSIISMVQKFDLDGFDLDWEYPGQRGGAPNDKDNLVLFLNDLYPYFVSKGWELSAAVSANANQLQTSYNVKHLSDHLSFINVMAYDLHGSWEETAGHHTALYASPLDSADTKHLNVDAAIRRWLELGAAPEKLNLGLGTYGRSMTLINPRQNKIGAPIGGIAPCGWIQENGFYGYNEICFNNKTEWTTEWDDIQKVPFAYSGNKWVGYDDAASIKIKTCYAKSQRLGGIMFWSVETDDFAGRCNAGKYPLVQAGIAALQSNCGASDVTESPVVTSEPEPETEAPVFPIEPETDAPVVPIEPETEAPVVPIEPETESPEPIETEAPVIPTETEAPTDAPATEQEPTTADPTTNNQCQSEGQMLRDPLNCSQYLVCLKDSNGSFAVVAMKCSSGLVFDPTIRNCNYRSAYRC